LARNLSLTSAEASKRGLKVNQDGRRRTALDFIAAPEVGFDRAASVWPELAELPRFAREALEAEALYSGYLERQDADIVALRKDEALMLSADLDYQNLSSISAEIRQKLCRIRPATIGQAARIEGMTPAALIALLGHVRRRKVKKIA
jgi:tRNA uridine 5-carboxymethylaminomethyl modification enzyme